MDTTSKYVKMCEEAVEIQKLWEKDWYDFYVSWWKSDDRKEWLNSGNPLILPHYIAHWEYPIWLPRQDQLQKMLDYQNQSFLVSQFDNFIDLLWLEENCWVTPETSLEQLWLAFVMYEKYGKVWHREKEEWISESEPIITEK